MNTVIQYTTNSSNEVKLMYNPVRCAMWWQEWNLKYNILYDQITNLYFNNPLAILNRKGNHLAAECDLFCDGRLFFKSGSELLRSSQPSILTKNKSCSAKF